MSRRRLLALTMLTLTLLPTLAVPARSADAATSNATTTADAFGATRSGTACSLRDAIRIASTDTALGAARGVATPCQRR